MNYDWLMVIDNVEDLYQYHEAVTSSQIHHVWDNLGEVAKNREHISTTLGSLIWHKANNNKEKNMIQITVDVLNDIFLAKAHAITEWGKIYINKFGGFFPFDSYCEILDEMIVEPDRLIFPQYTEADIRIKQWENGTHYYAYVGAFQVEGYNNEKKWNTYDEAYKAAQTYIYKLSRHQYKIKG